MIQNLQSRINGYRRKYASMRRWQKTIVFLAALVVFITTYALILPALTLENQTYCGYETGASEPVQVLTCTETDQEHVHQASCYELQSAAEGGTPVHEHTLQCFSNPDADVENTGIWEQMASAVNLTGVKNEDLVTMARSQLGYTESQQNYRVADDNTTMNGYTRYGAWCGDPYIDWNTVFCAFCLNYAGIDENAMPREENCQEWMDVLQENHLFADVSHTPAAGNLVFIDRNGDGKADQMGVVDQLIDAGNSGAAQFRTIQGDVDNSVRYVDYGMGDNAILGYGVLDAAEELSDPAAAETDLVADQSVRSSARRLLAGEAPNLLADTGDSDQYDMNLYITTVNIQHRATDDDIWENIQNGGTVHTGDQLRFDISYELPERTLDEQNRTIHYQVPDKFEIIKADTGTVKDGSGARVGTYVITKDGSVSITFDEDYAKKNADGSKINGHIAFESSVDNIKKNDDGSITIPFKEEIRLDVKELYGDIKVEKTSDSVDTFNGTLKYRIEITSQTGTEDKVVLKDTPTNVQRTGELHIVDQNGNAVTNFSVSEDGNTITLPKMNKDGKDKYIITYDAELTSAAMETLNKNSSNVTATNEAVASSKDSEGQNISSTSSVKNTFTRNIISKTGEYKSEKGYIDWTIKVNSQSAYRVDLSGWKLSDEFNGATLNPDTKVTISPNPETGKGSIETHLPYTFPKDSTKTTYTVTYRTEGNDKSYNKAVLTPPNGPGIETGTVKPKSVEVEKKALSQDFIGTDASGNVLVEQKWHVNVTASMVVRADKQEYFASVNGSDTKVFPNGGYWQIREQLGESSKMWFTYDQAMITADQMIEALNASGYTGNYYIFTYDNQKTKQYRLLKKSEGSKQYYDNATSWNKLPEPKKDDRYDTIYMIMDNDWTPTQSISFDVINTLNTGEHEATVKSKNTATCRNADFEVSSTANQTYMPVLSKYDYRYVDEKSTGIKPTEHSMNDVISGGLQWEIGITLPKDIEYTNEVVITDTIPEGTYIRRVEGNKTPSQKQSVCFAGPSTNGIFGKGGHIPIPYTGAWDVQNLKANAVDGKGTLTQTNSAGTYNMDYELNATREHAEENAFDQVVLKIPADLANRLKGYTFYLLIYAYPDSYDFVEESYNNEVTATYKNDVLDRANQEQTVKAKTIQKGVVKDSGSTKLHEDKTIPYVICVNPTGADLVAGTNDLTVSDELSYVMPANGTINVSLNSIRVFKATEKCSIEGFKHIYDELNDGTRSYEEKDAILKAMLAEDSMLEEISDCPYTIEESTAGGKVVYTYNAKVPDGEKLLLFYDYKFSGTGRLTDVTNKASVYGLGSGASSEGEKINITVQQSSADAVLVGVNVYKVDSKNYAVHLNGAKFKLEMYNGSSWEQVGKILETNEEEGYFNTGKLQDNTAYRLTETEAPKGYEMKTPTVYEFYIRNTASDAHPECKPSGFEGKALNNGDEILIANDLITYELPHTGGIGTIPYILCGMAVMAIAAAFGLRRKFSRER